MPQPETTREPRIVCTVPTFNEAGNIVPLCEELVALGPNVQVVVIDDASPDGTAALVETLAAQEPRVHLLLRTSDSGRGRSGRDGFLRALEMDAEIVVEMDADFSHNPSDVPRLIEAAAQADLVLGSRYVAGIRVINWPLHRLILSRGASPPRLRITPSSKWMWIGWLQPPPLSSFQISSAPIAS